MKISLKRVTSSGNFIPEIDGLRFIAIISVVIFHLNLFLTNKDHNSYEHNSNMPFLTSIFNHGHLGVPIFFVISGFVLALPFAKFYLKGEKPVNLKNYFFRRLTRIEPPYIIIMTLLLFGVVFMTKTVTPDKAMFSYFSSIFYIHNFVYGKEVLPYLNVVAWSLEIEVQFYILAPLIAYLFSIRSSYQRRVLLLLILLLFLTGNYFLDLPFRSLINYLQYFLAGFLLADLYISGSNFLPKTIFDTLIGVILLAAIFGLDAAEVHFTYQKVLIEICQLTGVFFLSYYILINKIFRVLSMRLFTDIGGMCYSIYLIHYPLISIFGNPLVRHKFSSYQFVNLSVYSVFLFCIIIGVSAIFFLLVEKPFMDKNWYKNILGSFKR